MDRLVHLPHLLDITLAYTRLVTTIFTQEGEGVTITELLRLLLQGTTGSDPQSTSATIVVKQVHLFHLFDVALDLKNSTLYFVSLKTAHMSTNLRSLQLLSSVSAFGLLSMPYTIPKLQSRPPSSKLSFG